MKTQEAESPAIRLANVLSASPSTCASSRRGSSESDTFHKGETVVPIDRRDFLIGSASAAAGLWASSVATARGEPAASTPKSGARLSNPIAVSTYSFWRYRAARMRIEDCNELPESCASTSTAAMFRWNTRAARTPERPSPRAWRSCARLSPRRSFMPARILCDVWT